MSKGIFMFNDIECKFQVIAGNETYKEKLKHNDVKVYEEKERQLVAKGEGASVECQVYCYDSVNTGEKIYIYEYIETHAGEGEFGCYVVGSSREIEDIYELYDEVMKFLAP